MCQIQSTIDLVAHVGALELRMQGLFVGSSLGTPIVDETPIAVDRTSNYC